jgi:hypothetical protein
VPFDLPRKEAVMAKRFYTVLVLPDATSAPTKLHISKTTMATLSSVVAMAIVAFAFFLYQYVNLNVRMLELQQLRQEAGKRDAIEEKIRQLEGELSKVRDLDRRLRVVVGLERRGPSPTLCRAAPTPEPERPPRRDAPHRPLEAAVGDLTASAGNVREQACVN